MIYSDLSCSWLFRKPLTHSFLTSRTIFLCMHWANAMNIFLCAKTLVNKLFNGKMTIKWQLNLSWTKWGLQFQLGQIRHSHQFVQTEVCVKRPKCPSLISSNHPLLSSLHHQHGANPRTLNFILLHQPNSLCLLHLDDLNETRNPSLLAWTNPVVLYAKKHVVTLCSWRNWRFGEIEH